MYEGDALKFEPYETFKIEKFDIVLGNPPFNFGGIKCNTKNETIWNKFVEKSFEWLKPNEFLLFITPLSWLKKVIPFIIYY